MTNTDAALTIESDKEEMNLDRADAGTSRRDVEAKVEETRHSPKRSKRSA